MNSYQRAGVVRGIRSFCDKNALVHSVVPHETLNVDTIHIHFSGVSALIELDNSQGQVVHWYNAKHDLNEKVFGCVNKIHHRKATTWTPCLMGTLHHVLECCASGKSFIENT